MTDDEAAALRAAAEAMQRIRAEYVRWDCTPAAVLSLLDEREALRAALEYAVPVLEEAQEALLECDDVCMTEDGDDAFAVAILKARAALSGSAAP